MEEPQEPTFEMRVPPDLEAGRYSNFVSVWHTLHDFTLDFSATLPPAQQVDGVVVVPAQVVARVKIAPSLIFDLMRALNENMTRYEASFGEIQRPDPRGEQE